MDIIRRVRSRNTNEASESSTGSRWTIGTFGRSSPTTNENSEEDRDLSVPPLPEPEYPMTSPSPAPAPVVLNWQPSELYDNTPDPHLELQRAELERLGRLREQSIGGSRPPSFPGPDTVPMPSPSHMPLGDLPAIIITEGSHPGQPLPPAADADQMPPGYEESRFPTVPVVYSFSPTSSGSMLLIPPPAHPDSRPLYHVSVQPNVFIPLFYKTRVTRGGSVEGEEVGDFEMSILPAYDRNLAFGPLHESTVSMRGKEHPLDMILTKESTRKYHWRFVVARMKWDCSSVPYRCALHADETSLASFTPATGKREPGRPPPLATLEILPSGFKYLDDIVVSILAIERKRLTPQKYQPHSR